MYLLILTYTLKDLHTFMLTLIHSHTYIHSHSHTLTHTKENSVLILPGIPTFSNI